MAHINSKRGFTLIELSIVLVIIGLIVGGVLVGRDLIKAAELRKTIQEVESLNSAVNAFRLKYNCIPGDCATATQFWTAAATCPHDYYIGYGYDSPQTCNGDGDGLLGGAEVFALVAHLSNAQLVGQQAMTAACCAAFTGPSTNSYKSAAFGDKYNGQAGFSPYYNGALYSIGVDYPWKWFFAIDNKTYWILGGTAFTNLPNLGPIMSAEQAFNIDGKMDDGKPGKGTVQGVTSADFYSLWSSRAFPDCATTTDASTAAYNLSGGGKDACSLIFRMGI